MILICESNLSSRARLCMKSCPMRLGGLVLTPRGHCLMGSARCLSNLSLFLPGGVEGSEQMSGPRSALVDMSQYINRRDNRGTVSHPDSIESTSPRRSYRIRSISPGSTIPIAAQRSFWKSCLTDDEVSKSSDDNHNFPETQWFIKIRPSLLKKLRFTKTMTPIGMTKKPDDRGSVALMPFSGKAQGTGHNICFVSLTLV